MTTRSLWQGLDLSDLSSLGCGVGAWVESSGSLSASVLSLAKGAQLIPPWLGMGLNEVTPIKHVTWARSEQETN